MKDDNPGRTFPFVTMGLIGLNVAAFLYEAFLPLPEQRALILQMGLVPAEIMTGRPVGSDFPLPLTLFTSMFLHGGLLHLAGNMLYLYIFGNNVEDATGHFSFLVFYLLCGLAAAGTQVAAAPRSLIPMIGASGAIAGVLGAYMVLFPKARVLTLVPIFIFVRLMYLPAILVLGLWFVYQLLLSGSAYGGDGGGVAFFAHIGGFVAGMALVWLFRKRRPSLRVAEW
ncbi:MAG TPA: rhomboid family intramembrane serine protease [Candidatus Polarisedimenticolia bacterium]